MENLMDFKVLRPKQCHKEEHSFVKPGARCPICLPIARSGHRMFCDNGYIYVLGGFNPISRNGSSLIKDIWALNKYTEEWTPVRTDGDFPDEMASFSIAQNEARNCTFVFGGTGVPFGSKASNKMRALVRCESFDHWRWREIETFGEGPSPIYGQSMEYVEGDGIYIIGGTTGFEYNMNVYKLIQPRAGPLTGEILNMKWEWSREYLTKDSDIGRYRHEMVQLEEGFLLVGGGTPRSSLPLSKLLLFNIKQKAFVETETLPDKQFGFPCSRRCHVVVRSGNWAFIVGGCKDTLVPLNDVPELKPLDDMWALELTTLQWEKRRVTMDIPVYFHAGVLTEEKCLFTFGGCTDQGISARSDTLERIWLQPPPLLHTMFTEYAQKIPQKFTNYDANLLQTKFSLLLKDCMDAETFRRSKSVAAQ